MRRYYLAIDMGASSGRAILSTVENGIITLEEINRFDNHLIDKNGHLTWDIDNLWDGIIAALEKSGVSGRAPSSMGIDTWGVDFVLLDKEGNMIGDPVAYRDSRTSGMREETEKYISTEDLYARTGIQYEPFNTLYQLMALKKEHPDYLEQAESLLMIPDYFNFLLTGVKKQEYTNASTSNLVNARKREWDMELIESLGIPKRLFGPLSFPGTVVGQLSPKIQERIHFNTTVVLPATHDTGSAFLSAAKSGEGSLILSSGTWSLLGVENKSPITTDESRNANFTNEGGAWHRYRYLKNIMGLWMIQSVRRELNGVSYISGKDLEKEPPKKIDLGESKDFSCNSSKNAGTDINHHVVIDPFGRGEKTWEFGELSDEARKVSDFTSVVDVNEDRFLSPDSMIDEVRKSCKESGQKIPSNVGELMQCLYLSLTECYRKTVAELSSITGKKYNSINIIGGGCQDRYLDEMTARHTGLKAYAGPVEGTAIGNLVVQMIAAGEFKDLSEARECIAKSFEIREFE